MFSPLEQFDVILYLNNYFPIPFLNLQLPMVAFFSLLILIVSYLKENLKLVPTVLQYICESLVKFIFNLITQQIGKLGYVYFPLIFTIFNFILIMNLFSLMPFGLALTSHIIMIFWLGISICLSIFFIGLFIHNIKFLYIFIPECPIILLPMLILIEVFSYIIRAFSLAIRLSANIMAGHTLVHIIASFVLLISVKIFGVLLGFSFLFAILLLELGVAFLQAYVFCVLICIYLNDALKGPSH